MYIWIKIQPDTTGAAEGFEKWGGWNRHHDKYEALSDEKKMKNNNICILKKYLYVEKGGWGGAKALLTPLFRSPCTIILL